MDYGLGGGDDDEENEYADLEEAEAEEQTTKDAIIFAIDARQSMTETGPDGGASPLAQALGCVQASMKRRVQAGDSDFLAILLFGTDKSKAAREQTEFPCMYVAQDFDVPSGKAMRELQSLVDAGAHAHHPNEHRPAPARYGPASRGPPSPTADGKYVFGHMHADDDALKFENVIWTCSTMFNSDTRTKRGCRRRVYMMTNDTDPSRGNASSRSRTMTRAKDLEDAGIWLEPFFFQPPPPATLDLSTGSFWFDFVSAFRKRSMTEEDVAKAEEDGTPLPAEDTSDAWTKTCVCGSESELLDRVARKLHRKRTLGKVTMRLGAAADGGDGTAISLNLLRLVAEYKKPTSIKVHANDPTKTLKSDTAHLDTQNGGRLTKSDMWKGYDFGGRWVYFEHGEVANETAALCAPGLQLLGFHDEGWLKAYHLGLEVAYFAEAAEGRREGSAAALEALVGSMVRKRKIGVGTLAKGHTNKPMLVAMLPQNRALDSKGGVAEPCGLHLVPLPYADDLRKPPLPPPVTADELTEAQRDAASRLVSAMTLPAERNVAKRPPSHPGRHKYFAYMDALSLGETTVEPTIDGTLPDAEWIGERADELGSFKEIFGVPDEADQVVAGSSSSGAKRQKVEKSAPPESVSDWLRCYREGSLDKQTMPLLKEFLKSQSLPVGGKKDDLVKRAHDKLAELHAEDANAVAA